MENYDPDSRQPYGTSVIKEFLQSYFPGDRFKPIDQNLASGLTPATKGSYIFIGSAFDPDSLDLAALMAFIRRGNDAFIAAGKFTPDLLTFLSPFMPAHGVMIDSAVSLNYFHTGLKAATGQRYTYVYRNESRLSFWAYLDSIDSMPGSLPLGYIEPDFLNFAKLPYGDGNVYIHTTPIIFTNYHLLSPQAQEFTEKTLAHLREGDLLWDNYLHQRKSRGSVPPVRSFSASPLQYILSQPGLQWSWYLLLSLTGLFLLFRAKRQQRKIPVVAANTNSTMEFIETVGSLYFQQKDHSGLIRQKMNLFLSYIRNRYRLSTQTTDQHFIRQLSDRSQLPYREVQTIFDQYDRLKNAEEISHNMLIIFHLSIQRFYKKSKRS